MDCYAFHCQERDECDDLVKGSCLRRLTKEQHELKKKLGNTCSCGSLMIEAKRGGEETKICFSCGKGAERKRRG